MQKSESIEKLAAALCKMQGEMKVVAEAAVNPCYKSKYADLAMIWEAIRVPLAANGLSIAQPLKVATPDMVTVETMLMHSSGQWLSGEISLKPVKNDPQGMGSAVTYARRYSLSAMVGVVSEEDDDGNKASYAGQDQQTGDKLRAMAQSTPKPIDRPQPRAEAQDIPPPDDADFGAIPIQGAAAQEDSGDFIITHNGFSKGKRLRDIPRSQIEKDIAFWSSKTPKPDTVRFLENAREYLSQT